jgi:hypothetical protein
VSFATLTVPGPTVISFNDGGSGGGYHLETVTGIDQAPIRAPIDDAPQTDGGIVHQFFYGPRHLTLEGVVLPAATDTPLPGLNVALDQLVAALDAILRADGTFAWTPPGLTERSLTVRCDVPVAFTGRLRNRFIFGLVAADPTITVA